MCGIGGLVMLRPSEGTPAALEAMGASLRHRGPDDLGYLGWDGGDGPARNTRGPEAAIGARVALVHRRLSILDLTEGGHQPMSSADGRYHIVYNGEIYNYLELRDELAGLGHEFRSQSDTEVLLAACMHWGPAALRRLVGMFAFAVLDTHRGKLLLARDPFGIKPLYYTTWDRSLAFASEIKALLTLPRVRPVANPQRVYEYLRFGFTDGGAETMFAPVRQLPPAHFMEVDVGAAAVSRTARYWRIDTSSRMDISFEEAAERLRAMFLENVRLHLRSDVPVGAALSGGIDSSAIAMAMRRVQGPGAEIHAFTHVAEGELSEERWADMVASRAGIEIHKVAPNAQELVEDLDELIAVQDEPFGSTSIYAQLRVFRLVREAGIKVMLDGQGADELMAGYRPHLAARLVSLLRKGDLHGALRFWRSCARLPGTNAVTPLVRAIGLVLPRWLRSPASRAAGRSMLPGWLDGEWLRRSGVIAEPAWDASGPCVLREHLCRALTDRSLPLLLRYEDRNSMAHSVESRVPFLTPAMAEFVLSLPEEHLLSADAASKAVFRRAMRGIVPDAILARRDKIGFAAPERQWFTVLRGWVDRVLADASGESVAPLAMDSVRRLWQNGLSDKRPFDLTIWRCVNLICWARCRNVTFEA